MEPFVSDEVACIVSGREARLGRCRDLGLGLELTSSCWGDGHGEKGNGGGLHPARRGGGDGLGGTTDSGVGAAGRILCSARV